MTQHQYNTNHEQQKGWSETASSLFLDLGKLFTPRRDEIKQTFLDLIPAHKDETFTAVELGCGQGWLSEAILENFPHAQVIALDGSERMLNHARNALALFADRVEFHQFQLQNADWLPRLHGSIRCFLSCLVIHHLDGAGKQKLFQDLFERLQPGGALLIADLVAPANDKGREQMATAWDREVQRQSLAATGNLQAYERFLQEQWNYYDYPDDLTDMPSTTLEQLQWLHNAGFVGVDVFWAIAGHALFGGFKPL